MKFPFSTALRTGLIVGTLDGIAAIILYYVNVKGGNNPGRVFQYIASAAIGKDSFSGGWTTILLGVLFHYFIACTFTFVFFFVYPRLKLLHSSAILSGLIYGIVIWMIMNLLVIPMTRLPESVIKTRQAITGILILMCVVGLPMALIAKNYYRKNFY
jgi:hypothetical protein